MNMTPAEAAEEYYTLLAVRADGVAPVVDLMLAETFDRVRAQAQAMLAEHASCRTVEVWRGGVLLEEFSR